jgi:hypothetical protein
MRYWEWETLAPIANMIKKWQRNLGRVISAKARELSPNFALQVNWHLTTDRFLWESGENSPNWDPSTPTPLNWSPRSCACRCSTSQSRVSVVAPSVKDMRNETKPDYRWKSPECGKLFPTRMTNWRGWIASRQQNPLSSRIDKQGDSGRRVRLQRVSLF